MKDYKKLSIWVLLYLVSLPLFSYGLFSLVLFLGDITYRVHEKAVKILWFISIAFSLVVIPSAWRALRLYRKINATPIPSHLGDVSPFFIEHLTREYKYWAIVFLLYGLPKSLLSLLGWLAQPFQ